MVDDANPLSRRRARELLSATHERRDAVIQVTRMRSRKLLSLGALVGAAALLIGTSVPASAFRNPETGLAPEFTATPAEGQAIEVSSDAVAAAPVRDGFEVLSYAEQLRQLYASAPSTFTATSGPIRWPFPYTVVMTDRFGPRPEGSSGSAFHNGLDFTPGGGTPIYAIADGIVAFQVEDQGGFGNHVIIQHQIPGQNVASLYAHMQYGTSPLRTGDTVRVGDFIGLVGNTGDSYGNHLHFEIRIDGVPVDPFAWLSANAV